MPIRHRPRNIVTYSICKIPEMYSLLLSQNTYPNLLKPFPIIKAT